jgi:protein-export membrane protein SecD
MLYFNRWKIFIILGISFASILFTLPNFIAPTTLQALPSWLQMRMPLGLDLQGGSHLLLQMNIEELRREWLESINGEVRNTLRTERIGYTGLATTRDEVRVTIRDQAQADNAFTKLKALARPINNNIFGTSTPDLDVTRAENGVIALKPTEAAINDRITSAMGSAIETVRRRIDITGTTEPIIQRQGRDRILVQVPGFNDPAQLKALIGKTAKLTFQLVDQTMTVEEAMKGNPPPGSQVYPAQEGDQYAQNYLLQKRVIVSGEDLIDAQPGFDQRTSEPIVTFRFNSSGAQRFGKVTQENVGRPFAIVLDGNVISAPVIRDAILGGTGQISGNFSVESANTLSILLRSGALPASLDVIEERSVGPSLGADSIQSGTLASILAFLAVTTFMILGYGLFGFFSIIALVVNVAIIMAVLSLMQATLTLPGIAGIALTMGVAVDANVLIYERMREEARSGKAPVLAIESGFSRAYATIIDSHLTALLGGVILYWLGVGPIRGFAVTLCIGTIASLFTAITLTRLIVATWFHRVRPAAVPL